MSTGRSPLRRAPGGRPSRSWLRRGNPRPLRRAALGRTADAASLPPFDAHAAAWRSVGLIVETVQDLPPGPARRKRGRDERARRRTLRGAHPERTLRVCAGLGAPPNWVGSAATYVDFFRRRRCVPERLQSRGGWLSSMRRGTAADTRRPPSTCPTTAVRFDVVGHPQCAGPCRQAKASPIVIPDRRRGARRSAGRRGWWRAGVSAIVMQRFDARIRGVLLRPAELGGQEHSPVRSRHSTWSAPS